MTVTRRAATVSLTSAGAALLAGCETPRWSGGSGASSAGEGPLETTRIRLARATAFTSPCQAPHYLASEFLRAEGFTDVSYTKLNTTGTMATQAVTAGEADLAVNFAGPLIMRVDAGDPLTILTGVHPGCLMLFGTERVQAVRDLKGKTVAVGEMGGVHHVFVSTMAAHVGVDPRSDIMWVIHPAAEAMRLLAQGQIDAYLAAPPTALELRDRRIGHVVVDTTMDRPWSQYFCCMEYANAEFARKHPVATRRALRAIARTAEFCAREPERAAQLFVDAGYTNEHAYTLEAMREIRYDQWRVFDPEDTIRFHALRLKEAGMIKSTPQQIIAQGTDWRFLKELKEAPLRTRLEPARQTEVTALWPLDPLEPRGEL